MEFRAWNRVISGLDSGLASCIGVKEDSSPRLTPVAALLNLLLHSNPILASLPETAEEQM